MSKLLFKPFKLFTVYALLVLLLSIPAYYFVVDHIWMSELDEHNTIIKNRIQNRIQSTQLNNDELNKLMSVWSIIQPGVAMEAYSGSINYNDSLYLVDRLTEGADGSENDRFRGLKSVVTVNSKLYLLSIETNVEEVDETLSAIIAVTLAFFILLAVGFLIIHNVVSKQIWMPFKSTLNELKSFDLSNGKAIRFQSTQIQEFNDLNSELSNLIDKNLTVFNQQKVFLENLSHEIQTPLAILKSKVELLLQNESIAKDQANLIQSIHLSLNRVSRLNKNLLLLAKVENGQFDESEEVDVLAVLNDHVYSLEDFVKSKSLSIEINSALAPKVFCNKVLIEIAIGNLLNNAVLHSNEKSQIVIDCESKSLSISNSGSDTLNEDLLFQRYVSFSSDTKGSGLGLSIVKGICKRYNWQVNYRFSEKFHVFSMKF